MSEPGAIETAPPVESAPAPESSVPAVETSPAPLPDFFDQDDPNFAEDYHKHPTGEKKKKEPQGSEYEALVNFDPFGPAEVAAVAPAKPAPQATPAAPGAGQAPVGQAPAPVPSPAPAGADPRDLQLRLMQEQLDTMRAVLQHTGRTSEPARGEAPKDSGPPDDTPPYNFNIPDQWVEGLASEDPAVRKLHLAHLLQGTAQAIHRTALAQVRQEIAAQVPNQIQQVIQTREMGQQVEQDYYGTYRHHIQVRPLVAQITKQVFTETGAQGWSPQIRDAIGSRVQAYLQAAITGMQQSGVAPVIPMVPQGVQAPAAPVAPAPAQVVQRAPHVFGGIASPGVGIAAALNPNSPDGIADAFSIW